MKQEVAVTEPKVPVPAKLDDWVRQTKAELTLNDMIEAIHRQIVINKDVAYRRFLDATMDTECVEGSISADDLEAAAIIRKFAKEHGNDYVAGLRKATIVRSLRVVLRRYGEDRKSRRYRVGGVQVPPEPTTGNSDSRAEDNGDNGGGE